MRKKNENKWKVISVTILIDAILFAIFSIVISIRYLAPR